MGIIRALPLGASSTRPRARGPRSTFFPRLLCAGEPIARSRLIELTSAPAMRYNFDRKGETVMNTNDKAPEFTLPDQDGKDVSLKDFRGKTVVLFFYPKADTPG